ncbi:MAG: hypothetical protein H6Q89_5721 [Myxococcaceae bacterium]|nr:hypothetical protein [Myxococcaceae bacterium]
MPPKLQANPTPKAFAAAWSKEVLRPALEKLAGVDGRLTKSEVRVTTSLTGAAKFAADNVLDVFTATKVKSSTSVATALKAGERLALAAAKSAAGADGKLSAADMDTLAKFTADFGFLVTAQNQNLEIGVVSDLDSTVIPPEQNGLMPAPYPGVAALYNELDTGSGGSAGDVRYVTARSPDRVTGIPDYLNTHHLPSGTIDTGTSQLPWVSQPEKVRDISRIFEANPDQKFVLFGDTRHKDPEVYKEIAAKYPNQVTAIFINKVEAAAQLLKDGVFTEAAARRVMVAAKAEGLAITTAQIETLIRDNR